MNIFQKAITPDLPRVLEGEQIYVYVPQATSTNAGIASYKNEDFKVNDGVVSLRWPVKSLTQGPLANPSLIKVQDSEFEYTNINTDLTYEGSKTSSSTIDVQLKRELRDAYSQPDFVMLDEKLFPREIIEKDGKQYYKYNTTAVHYIIQSLTDAQKKQARDNIDAGSNQDIKIVNDRVTQTITDINNRVDEILTLKVTSVNGKIGDVILKNSDLENDTNYSTIDFVNSSIATNTATFRGTYNSLDDLFAYTGDKDDNDYAFVIEIDSVGNTLYNRYKYNGTEWLFEYSLNNSSFTQAQWTAINSGITNELTNQIIINTNKLSGIENGAQVNTVTSVNSKTGLVVLTADDVNAIATSGGTIDGYLKIKGTAAERHLITRGIGGCSSDTATTDDLYVNFGTDYGLIVGKTGQFNVDKDGNIITSGNIQGFTIYENNMSLIDKYQLIGDYATNTALDEVSEIANYAKEKANEALNQVVEGLGSKVYINDVLTGTINFTSDPQSQINTISTNKADITYVDTKIANLVNSAPEALDTLGELATALQEHEDAYDALLETIGNKVAKTDVEDFLSATSANPVQNKVLYYPVTFAESERQKSKNLFKSNFWNKSSNVYENNGITFTYNPDDYSVTINGTATNRALCYLNVNAVSDIGVGTYTFSGFNQVTPTNTAYVQVYNKALDNYPALLYSHEISRTISFTDVDFAELYISVYAGATCNNLVLKFQAEEGSVATDYQLYHGPITHNGDAPVVFAEAERQKSKNLIPYPYYDGNSKTINGIIFTVNNDGSITISGTATANAPFTVSNNFKLSAGTYHSSFLNSDNEPLVSSMFVMELSSNDDSFPIQNFSADQTKAVPEISNGLLRFIIKKNAIVNDTYYPQLEIGDTFTGFKSYNGQIVHDKELDTRLKDYLPLSGGTMTGSLSLTSVPTVNGTNLALTSDIPIFSGGSTSSGTHYYKFCAIKTSDIIASDHASVTVLLSGVGNFGSSACGTYLITMGTRSSTRMTVIELDSASVYGNCGFGYVENTNDNTIDFYVRTTSYNYPISVVIIQNSNPNKATVKSFSYVDSDPGLTYVTPTTLATSNTSQTISGEKTFTSDIILTKAAPLINVTNTGTGSDASIRFTRSDTENSCYFGIGAGGVNRGFYDLTQNRWILYCDGSKSNLNSATVPSGQTLTVAGTLNLIV